MIKVTESEAKITSRKKTISVKEVTIRNNQLVDIETGETDVLDKIAAEIPDGVEAISFKISFDLPDEE